MITIPKSGTGERYIMKQSDGPFGPGAGGLDH